MVSSTINVCLTVLKFNLPKSDNFQVVRYTALFAGVVYGWYRHRSLQATYNENKLRDARHHRERLIVQAKEAWKRKLDSAKGATRMFFPSLNLAGYMICSFITSQSSRTRRTLLSTLKNYCCILKRLHDKSTSEYTFKIDGSDSWGQFRRASSISEIHIVVFPIIAS